MRGRRDRDGPSPVLASAPAGPDSFLGGNPWAVVSLRRLSFLSPRGGLGLCVGPGIIAPPNLFEELATSL